MSEWSMMVISLLAPLVVLNWNYSPNSTLKVGTSTKLIGGSLIPSKFMKKLLFTLSRSLRMPQGPWYPP